MSDESVTQEVLLGKVMEDGKDSITEDQFVSLMEICSAKDTLPVADQKRFFQARQTGGGRLPAEAFYKILCVQYKVVKDTVMTTDFQASSTDSKVLRKVLVGEIVEAMEAPVKDDSVNVVRVMGRCVEDG